MRLSSSFVAPSAVAVVSTIMLCGPATSQTATGSAASLPSITVQAPKQVARPHRPERVASRRTSSTAQPSSASPGSILAGSGSVMAKLAELEKTSSNCTDGCQTSFKYGNQPWNGCSTTGDVHSTTCRNGRNYKTYIECMDGGRFLGWRNPEMRWYCSSLHAAGKLAGEKPQVAELKRSGRR